MRVERQQQVFRPITLIIETQKDADDLITALQVASRETGSASVEAFCDCLVSDLQRA